MNFLSENLRGALFMVISMAAFVINDATIKSLKGELELFQVVFLRGLFATTMIGLVAWRAGAMAVRIAPRDRKILVFRMIGEIGGTVCFLNALFNMPIANATAILQAMPLAVTLAASLFLGERVGWRRYSAIAVGFSGVLLIVKPGAEGFNAYSLYAVASVGFITLRDLSTRSFSPQMPSLFITFCTAASITVVGGVVSATGEWRPVSPELLAYLAMAAAFLLVGYLFGVMAMRVGEIAFVSPFRYSILIWAILLGMFVFGEFPSALTLAGAAVVVGTGVYTFYREQRLTRRSRP